MIALRLRVLIVAGPVLAAIVAAGCATTSNPNEESRPAVGFIFVGERDDLGYNQAAWEGHEAVAAAFPDVDVIGIEGVPETDEAIDALERLIADGASVLFATSFGHRDAAYEVARRHPDVVVVHQGGVEPDPPLDNFGTYFGTHAEAVYAAGITAGAATESGRLGFVVAFPIPATFNNVNAFLLGARQVRPDATVEVTFTDDWCSPPAQREAFEALRADGVDAVAQHQDCTATILGLAEDAGIAAVGYHSDGSEVAPTAWLTGAIWTWDDLYVDIVRTALTGGFPGSPYDGNFRGTLREGNNPFALSELGPSVSAATSDLVEQALERFRNGAAAVFEGPLRDIDGTERVPAGHALDIGEIDAMDFFIEGVIVRQE